MSSLQQPFTALTSSRCGVVVEVQTGTRYAVRNTCRASFKRGSVCDTAATTQGNPFMGDVRSLVLYFYILRKDSKQIQLLNSDSRCITSDFGK